MSILFSKHKKLILTLILILLISSLGIFALGAGEAKAGLWDLFKDPKTAIISLASNALYYIGFRPVSLLLSISGFLLDWAFGLEHFTDVSVVQEGWKIVRDLANMFFVLILLAIAFATILRIETYGMKALLPKLIIAALLINFSLVFCGVIIDFTQVLAHFFLDPFEGTGVSLSERVANGLNIMQIFEKKEEAAGLDALNILIGIMGGTAVILIMAFTMAVAAFFLIIRIVALWFLIVLAPIVWLLWILPATRNLWSQWWNAFLKWAFFAPAYAFFFYLAVITITGTGEEGGFLSNTYSTVPLGENEGWINAFFSSQELMLEYIFLIILLLGGIIVAQKMGVYGAQGAMGIARGAGKGVARWTGRRTQMAAARPAGAVGKGLGKAGDWMGKSRLGRWTGLAALTRQAGRGPRAFAEKERAAMAELEKKYQPWASDHIKRERPSASPRAKAAMDKIMAGRGEFKKDEKAGFLVTEKDIQDALKMAKRYEQHKEILKARPDLAPLVKRPEQTDKEAIREAVIKIKPADMGNLQKESLTPEVIEVMRDELTKADGQIRSNHLSRANELNPGVAVEIKQKIIDDPGRGPFRQDVETYLESDAGKAIFGEPKPRAEK